MKTREDDPSDPGREMFRILGLIVLMAALYGIVHDQITARIYPAYFNVDHPDLAQPFRMSVLWVHR